MRGRAGVRGPSRRSRPAGRGRGERPTPRDSPQDGRGGACREGMTVSGAAGIQAIAGCAGVQSVPVARACRRCTRRRLAATAARARRERYAVLRCPADRRPYVARRRAGHDAGRQHMGVPQVVRRRQQAEAVTARLVQTGGRAEAAAQLLPGHRLRRCSAGDPARPAQRGRDGSRCGTVPAGQAAGQGARRAHRSPGSPPQNVPASRHHAVPLLVREQRAAAVRAPRCSRCRGDHVPGPPAARPAPLRRSGSAPAGRIRLPGRMADGRAERQSVFA